MSKARNASHGQPTRDEAPGSSPEDIDIAHQFLADALHAGEKQSDKPGRAASTAKEQPARAEEHTRVRRRLDLRGDTVQEGSLFDDEAEELGETRAPELDTEDRPHRVTRARPPQR